MTQDASNSNIHSYICGEMPILFCNTSGVEVMGLPSPLHFDGEPWGGPPKRKDISKYCIAPPSLLQQGGRRGRVGTFFRKQAFNAMKK
jgi:hypothetical protein